MAGTPWLFWLLTIYEAHATKLLAGCGEKIFRIGLGSLNGFNFSRDDEIAHDSHLNRLVQGRQGCQS